MRLALRNIKFTIVLVLAFWQGAYSQDLQRELNIASESTVEITNKYGRVSIQATQKTSDLSATSSRGVAESEIKVSTSSNRTLIEVAAINNQKRVDLIIHLPERLSLKVATTMGAVEIVGNFASIDARSETGTIAVDVPADDLEYLFTWTESRPRYLADFDITEVKEKRAGRFEIKGRRLVEKVNEVDTNGSATAAPEVPRSVSLNFTTSRGIILLNVPPNEVISDLSERPLTNAAKAIVRSGDSLLMDAIRRATPKYFGDYARTLPPVKFEPTFAERSAKLVNLNARTKTALVRVTDMRNRAISGLGVSDFEVVEDGKAREILSVEPSKAPFNLVLLLDVSGSVENYVNFIRKAARNFVNTVGKDDRVAIVIFNEDVKMLSTFTTDKEKLSTSLDSFDAGGGTAYYDALAYTIADTLRPLKGERTAIVILTDGDDNRSFLAFDSMMGSIQESGALIYPLYVPSGLIALAAQNINADIDPLRKKYMSLTAKSEGEGDKLARVSGGVYYSITQIGQIQKAYEDIVVQMRSAYEVTFRSGVNDISGSGVSPRLKIRSNRENTFAAVTSVVAAKNN